LQKEHIEGKAQPLSIKLSSVGILLFISLQTIRDLDGGISGLHKNLAQSKLDPAVA
jgi:hypothetical protein